MTKTVERPTLRSIEGLSVAGLSYRYPKANAPAVDDVSFTAYAGEVHGLVGHNGAGKTTLLLLAAGMLQPLAGKVTTVPEPILLDRDPRVGLMTEKLGLYEKFTVQETLEVFADLHGLPAHFVGDAIDQFRLRDHADVWVRRLSTGLRKRLLIAVVTLPQPSVVLLDEPFSGIDPESVENIITVISAWKRAGRVVVVATHDLPELAAVADRITVLRQAVVLASSPTSELYAAVGGDDQSITITTRRRELQVPRSAAALRDVAETLARRRESIVDISMRRISLADVYARLHEDAET